MDGLLLQDWVTLRGATTVATLTQTETDWLDMTPYQDVVAWLEIKEFTPSSGNIPTIAYQTSPSLDDSLFFNMAPPITAVAGVTTTVMLKVASAGSPPLAKWVRWRIVVPGGVAWDLTFRIWIAANRIGGRVALSEATTLGDIERYGNWWAYGQGPTTPTTPTGGSGVPVTQRGAVQLTSASGQSNQQSGSGHLWAVTAPGPGPKQP